MLYEYLVISENGIQIKTTKPWEIEDVDPCIKVAFYINVVDHTIKKGNNKLKN